ncbi:MAG: hypothetical protein ACYCT1_09685 [Steroidobacteraceae bacterium]
MSRIAGGACRSTRSVRDAHGREWVISGGDERVRDPDGANP